MPREIPAFRRFFASTLGLDVLARGLSALSLVLFVRSLSTEAFAYIVLLQGVGQFGGSALTGGIRMRYMRAEAERVSRGDAELSSFRHPVGVSVGLIVTAALAGLAGAMVTGAGGSTLERLGFVGFAAALAAGHAGIELVVYHYQAHLKFARAGVIGVLRGAVLLGVGGLAVAGLVDRPAAIGAWLGGGMLVAAAAAAAPILLRTRGARGAIEGRFGLGSESAWLTVYYAVSAGYAYVSTFLVAALLSSGALASYGAATRYFAVVLGPLPALLAVVRVRTAQHDVVDSASVQADLLMNWIRRTTLPVLVLLGTAAIAAIWVIPILDGGRYPESIPVFQILLVSALFQYASMPSVNLLMAQRRYRLLALLYGAQLLIACALAVVGALLFGVIGVAVATTLSAVAENVAIALLSLSHSRRHATAAVL